MKQIYRPRDIPLHYFYFAWKKVKNFLHQDYGIYDPMEIVEFEKNLDEKLKLLKSSFSQFTYIPSRTYTYLLPKSPKDGIPRFRPMVQFSVRDQVAWTVMVLVLSEWFDSNEKIGELIPVDYIKHREKYNWMQSWSFNNRVKRIFQKNEFDESYDRLYVDYSGSSLYESFQWGLRNLREERKRRVEEILEKHEECFIGEVDIKEFYPNLKRKHILTAIRNRFDDLVECGVAEKDCIQSWDAMLTRLFSFEIDYTPVLRELENWNPDSFNLLARGLQAQETFSVESIHEYLNTTLPIGLIASGFLANCALTHFFDRKINEYICNEEKEHLTYITRYTDDMMILSSSSDNVVHLIQKIQDLLENIQLELAEDKVKPRIKLKERNEVDELIKKVTQSSLPESDLERLKAVLDDWNKDLEECGSPAAIARGEQVPGSTTVIEMLSQIGEHRMWAMDHEELEMYILELLKLIDTRFAESEIKDETKVAFSAWRIRSGTAEYLARGKSSLTSKATPKLLKAVERYPYKPSLIEYYIMHLFDISSVQSIENELAAFLNQFKGTAKTKKAKRNKIIHISDYGSYLRTRVMLAMSDHWNLLAYSMRKKVQGVVFKCVMNWYKQQPQWHEKAAMYQLFVNADLQRDPGALTIEHLDDETNPILKNSFALFKMNQQEERFYFVDYSSDGALSPERLKVLLGIWKKRRKRENLDKGTLSQEEKNFILWLWKLFMKRMERDLYSRSNIEFSICLAKHHIQSIPSDLFKFWYTIPDFLHNNNPLQSSDMVEVLDALIAEWIRYRNTPHFNFVVTFTSALNLEEHKGNKYFQYVKKRMLNIARIKQSMCMETNGLKLLPHEWQTDILNDGEHETKVFSHIPIPLMDWLTVIAYFQGKEMPKNVINPLSEMEILCLLNKVIHMIQADHGVEYIKLTVRRLTISIGSWSEWRQQLINGWSEGREQAAKPAIELDGYELDPYAEKIEKLADYIEQQMSEASIQAEDKDYIFCLLISILFMNITSTARSKEYYDISSILQWHNWQQIIKESYGPSSNVTSLLVSTLNVLMLIYQSQYERLGTLRLPYKAMSKEETITLDEYAKRIKEQIQNSRDHVVRWSQGLLEIIRINMDLISKDEADGRR